VFSIYQQSGGGVLVCKVPSGTVGGMLAILELLGQVSL
jgi:hypothetical protein